MCNNKRTIFSLFIKVCGGFFGILTTIVTLWPPITTCFFQFDLAVRILIFIGGFAVVFGITVAIFFFTKRKILWSNGEFSLVVQYDDLLKIAFPKKPFKKDRIVVIPVNTAFDTIVDPPGPMALVSASTVHGQFLNNLYKNGFGKDDVDKNISVALSNTGINPKHITKSRGNTEVYPLGTVIPLEFDASKKYKVSYALLAISDFDEKNNAHSSEEVILNCLQNLTQYLNQVSQGCDVYIPLMGTGESRANFSDKKALDTLEGFFIAFGQECHCNIHIVVYEKKRSSLSIFE